MVGKETKLSPSSSESRSDSNLNSRAEVWLERVKTGEEPFLELYLEGLGLLAKLAGVDPNVLPLKRDYCGEITVTSRKLKDCFSQGYEGHKGKIEKHTRIITSSLMKIDPFIAHPDLINETFFWKGKLLSSYKRKLELLKGAGVTEEGEEYPLILALEIKRTTQKAILEPVISRVKLWIMPRLTVSLRRPKDFFIQLLHEPEYYRGFDRRLKEVINQYAQKIFGKDAEKALSLWQSFISPRNLNLKRWVEITRIQQQWAKLLAERNWEKAEKFWKKLMEESPETFYLEKVKNYLGKKGRRADGTPFIVLRVEEKTHWGGKKLSEPRNYIRLGYPGQRRADLISLAVFLNGIDAGEFIFSD